MRITAKSDIGKVRTSNQDSYSAGELSEGVAWAVICDGMGGAAGGSVASSTSVRMVSRAINECYRTGMKASSIYNMLESGIAGANACLYDMAQNDESLNGMGTTCVTAIVESDKVYVAHVGDSRAYIVSADGKLTQLTRDHSMVQDLVENGNLTPEEAKNFPGKNIITRAIGVDSRVAVDFVESDFAQGDILVLCTDGLTNYVSDEEIVSVTGSSNCFEYAEKLVDLANENGGGDNITVVSIVS